MVPPSSNLGVLLHISRRPSRQYSPASTHEIDHEHKAVLGISKQTDILPSTIRPVATFGSYPFVKLTSNLQHPSTISQSITPHPPRSTMINHQAWINHQPLIDKLRPPKLFGANHNLFALFRGGSQDPRRGTSHLFFHCQLNLPNESTL